jgi:hypothetical protein
MLFYVPGHFHGRKVPGRAVGDPRTAGHEPGRDVLRSGRRLRRRIVERRK